MAELAPTKPLARKSNAVGLAGGESNFRLLVKSVKDYAIFMLSPEGVVTTWNKGAQSVKGYRSDEIIGKNFSQFYPRTTWFVASRNSNFALRPPKADLWTPDGACAEMERFFGRKWSSQPSTLIAER
jgi:PAS domain-containing protein